MSFCIYRLLYLKNSVFNRLFLYFQDYFSNASKQTARNLFFLVISILTLDIFRSVHFVHSHVISKLSDTSLNAFYYTLKMNAYTHSVWNDVTVSKEVRSVPGSLEIQPIFLSIDDTMIEKSGKHFELCSKLYDHAAHNGSNYLNGYCMVSLLLSFPVYQDEKILYVSVPVGYRLWDKEKWYMPWLLRPNTKKGAAVCSYAQLIRELFPLTGRIVRTKQPVLMGQKMVPRKLGMKLASKSKLI